MCATHLSLCSGTKQDPHPLMIAQDASWPN